MSPMLFNIFIDHIMREVKSLDPQFGLNASMTTDIRYICSVRKIPTSYVRIGKLRVLTSENKNISIENSTVPNVEMFKFLGSIVPECSSDVKK